MQISKAIKISRKCLDIVYQNIVVAIGVKLACLVLVALGFANMWLAVSAGTDRLSGHFRHLFGTLTICQKWDL